MILPAELSALVTYMKKVRSYHGSNQNLCEQIREYTDVTATPKGLKQKMNVWQSTLAEIGVSYESRKANGERMVVVRYIPGGTQVP